jgi:hypothetical protein
MEANHLEFLSGLLSARKIKIFNIMTRNKIYCVLSSSLRMPPLYAGCRCCVIYGCVKSA